MLSYPLVLDGVTYSTLHVVGLTRNFAVLDTELSGRNTAGAMSRDIVGTYYNYTMEIEADPGARADYDSFYWVISAPVESHTLTVPFGQTTLTFRAYITQGQDNLALMEPAANRWTNLQVSFIAMAPQRT